MKRNVSHFAYKYKRTAMIDIEKNLPLLGINSEMLIYTKLSESQLEALVACLGFGHVFRRALMMVLEVSWLVESLQTEVTLWVDSPPLSLSGECPFRVATLSAAPPIAAVNPLEKDAAVFGENTPFVNFSWSLAEDFWLVTSLFRCSLVHEDGSPKSSRELLAPTLAIPAFKLDVAAAAVMSADIP